MGKIKGWKGYRRRELMMRWLEKAITLYIPIYSQAHIVLTVMERVWLSR